MTSRSMALYGTDEVAPEEIRLCAGPLSAIFVGGALRDIRLSGTEVLRGISFLIRDRNWNTMVPNLEDLTVDQGPDSFAVSFRCRGVTSSDHQSFVWHGRIRSGPDHGIVFEANGASDEAFATCRTGFVVLHPLENTAGSPVEIEHSDGRRDASHFPDLIDPLQCFLDVVALTHEPIPGIRATCRMTGGAWESEDHRNWLDASFKTYFRALSLPWPYTIPAGDTVSQAVQLTFSPQVTALRQAPDPGPVQVVVGDRSGTAMPAIGLAVEPQAIADAQAASDRLTSAGCQHLTFRVRTDGTDLSGLFRQAARLVRAVGAAAHLEIVVSDRGPTEPELDLVALAAASAGFHPASVAVSPAIDLNSFPPSVDRPPSRPLRGVFEAARHAFPGVAIGGGMFSFFAELNRRRPPVDSVDFLQHGSASNIHAADDRSVMETLQSLPHVFRSTRAFAAHIPYRISTANIGLPFNPYGAATTPNPHDLRRTMVQSDPRQRGLFGAAFAAGYLVRTALGGIEAVTLMAPTGPFGIIGETGPRPVHAVVQLFARLARTAVLQTASSDPQSVLALAAEHEGRRTLVVVNLTADTRRVAVSGLSPAALSVLDEASGASFVQRPPATALDLPAYAVACLEA